MKNSRDISLAMKYNKWISVGALLVFLNMIQANEYHKFDPGVSYTGRLWSKTIPILGL